MSMSLSVGTLVPPAQMTRMKSRPIGRTLEFFAMRNSAIFRFTAFHVWHE
jgi:hypothetical protein